MRYCLPFEAIDLNSVFADEFLCEFWCEETVFKPTQNGCFQPVETNRQMIVAGAFITSVGIGVIDTTDRRHAAIAWGAFDQARERVEHAAKGVGQIAVRCRFL